MFLSWGGGNLLSLLNDSKLLVVFYDNQGIPWRPFHTLKVNRFRGRLEKHRFISVPFLLTTKTNNRSKLWLPLTENEWRLNIWEDSQTTSYTKSNRKLIHNLIRLFFHYTDLPTPTHCMMNEGNSSQCITREKKTDDGCKGIDKGL